MSDGINTILYDEKNKQKQTKVIVLSVEYKGVFENALDEFVQEDNNRGLQYTSSFIAIPSDIDYKPQHITNKPKIHGVLSAIVSNAQDRSMKEYANKIDIDEKGRIRVILHFDENKTTTTYLRLAHLSSGNNYGSQFIPRVNSEVLVSFDTGNPNKPIVIKSIYNGENKHPYPLPYNKTKSYIRTTSIPKYTDKILYNEILFEDKRNAESLEITTARDIHFDIGHKAYFTHDNCVHKDIKHNVEKTIKQDFISTVGNIVTTNIQGDDIKTVEKEEIETIQENKTQTLHKDFNTIVKNDVNTYNEANVVKEITKILHEYVEDDVSDKYLENLFINIAKDMGVDIEGDFHLDTSTTKIEAIDIVEIDTSKGISLRCGEHSLTIDSSGIHFNSNNVVDYSGDGGVEAREVPKLNIEKENIILKSNQYINQDTIYKSLLLKEGMQNV